MAANETDLWRTIGRSLAGAFGKSPGFAAHLTPTSWFLLTGEPIADFNWLLVDAGPDPAGQLREFAAVLTDRALPGLVLLTGAVAERLAPVASDLGLQPAGTIPLMVRESSIPGEEAGGPDAAAGRFRVEAVTDAVGLGEANRLAAAAFGLSRDSLDRVFPPAILQAPGLTYFLAREGDEPVSVATTTADGPTVGIWTMATPPERQRQGAGRAVLRHALAHHRARGAGLFYLLATEAGRPLYDQVGFRTLAEPAVWVRGQSVQVGESP